MRPCRPVRRPAPLVGAFSAAASLDKRWWWGCRWASAPIGTVALADHSVAYALAHVLAGSRRMAPDVMVSHGSALAYAGTSTVQSHFMQEPTQRLRWIPRPLPRNTHLALSRVSHPRLCLHSILLDRPSVVTSPGAQSHLHLGQWFTYPALLVPSLGAPEALV